MVLEKYYLNNLFNILGSLGLAILGLYCAQRLRSRLLKLFSKSQKNQTIKLFVTNSIYAAVLVVVGIIVLGKLGVPTASLVTLLGASSLAIGLALKDFLSNIAAGVILVFQKPFEIGDLVELSGTLGTVEQIDLFNVAIRTPSHEMITIPNGKLIKEKMINKAHLGRRRLELIIPVSYSSDLKKAKNLIYYLIRQEPYALSEPAPLVAVSNLTENGVMMLIQVWVKKDNFNPLKFSLLEEIKTSFEQNGIQIPFFQVDVNIQGATRFKKHLEAQLKELTEFV